MQYCMSEDMENTTCLGAGETAAVLFPIGRPLGPYFVFTGVSDWLAWEPGHIAHCL
jgi:hypothetical protein